jgi:hypothetical protein
MYTAVDPDNRLVVQCDDENWLTSVFVRIQEKLPKSDAGNRLVYSSWLEMLIQISIVIVIVAFTLKISHGVSNRSNMEYSEVYVFIAIFLLFSNIWTYAAKGLRGLRSRYFPAVGFKISSIRKFVASFVGILGSAVLAKCIDIVCGLINTNM